MNVMPLNCGTDQPRRSLQSCIVSAAVTGIGSRYRAMTYNQWELLALLLPKSDGHVVNSG